METRQRKDKSWWTEEFIDVMYSGIDGLKAAIADAESRLENLSFEVETQYDEAVAYISGWRPATPEEIVVKQDELQKSAAQQRGWEEKQAAQLRIKRPDLFQ